MNSVEIINLNFKYKNSEDFILKNLNFEINRGEITAIVGKSGSGKTTLTKCICGLISKNNNNHFTGKVLLFGNDISKMSLAELVTTVGIIFQNPSTQLFSPTIEDELAFGLENLCITREEIGKRIEYILKLIGMEEYRYENPNNLSGGQQQLIALASVLIMEPKILVCDEIMSWVDDNGRKVIKRVLLRLKEEGKTVIMVDHKIENIKIADKIIYM